MTTIYILRHGQTESNVRHTCLGLKDIPLNEVGKKQARLLRQRLSGISFDAVYTSPLQRAVETISPYLEGKDIKLSMSFGLIERDFGDWDDMTFDEIQRKYPDEFAKWHKNWISYKIPGGESAEDIQRRIGMFLDRLLECHDEQTVLLVTHLGAARHIISYLLGLSTEESWRFTLDNAGIAVVDTDGAAGLLKGLNIL